jgi:serine phosphatase RsbU (regulator of sigma subunit)
MTGARVPAEVDRLLAENAALSRDLARQRILVDAAHTLHSTLDQDELLGLILETASKAVDAERGTVYLVSEDGKEIWSRVVAGSESLVIRLPLGRGIAGAVARTGEVVRIDDAYQDPRFDPSTDRRSGYRTRSILCAPIKNRKGVIVGVFQLLNRRGGAFDETDVEVLNALSVQAALAIENAALHKASIEKERQDREIRAAQAIQRALLPERGDRTVGRLAVAAMNELCEDASGDYYDFLDLSDGTLGVAIGDVSGHGLGAAMVMAEARALYRAFSSAVEDVGKVLDLLNDFLSEDMTAGRFMSFFCASLHPETGAVRWGSAGHNPVLHYVAATGQVRPLDSTGRVLGVMPGAGYETGAPFTLEPGDALLLYTDGATEAQSPSGAFFGLDRLTGAFAASARDGPEAVLETVRTALRTFTGGAPNRDDLTLLAVTSGPAV